MADWNAELYNRFSKERMQPVIDLVSRLNDPSWKRIIDVGCGTGISTIPLRNKWPQAEIIGVDNSESMLAEARQHKQAIHWLKRDCSETLADLGRFDLVFSNAVLQWLPDQEAILRNLGLLLTEQGAIAVQLPNVTEMKIDRCIENAAKTYCTDAFVDIEKELYKCHKPGYYYDILAKYYKEIELWQTDYYHIMNSHEEIVSFYQSTGLRPYLNRLKEKQQEEFLREVLKEIRQQYPVQSDGKVLFEFKRIFFLARHYA